jgi:parallel beta-helix repeat protein
MIDNSKDFNYMDDQINIFQTGENMNAIFYILKGKVCIEECKFSLNVLKEENKMTITPCIVIERAGQLFMTRCELFGTSNQSQTTIGVLSKRGSAVIKESTFMNHRKSALYFSGCKDSLVTVSNCQIQKCYNGITLMGDFKGTFENNIIEDCENIGVKIGMCCQPRLAYNTIKHNYVGIDYVNSDPHITNNLVTMNKKDGIVSRSKELIRCGG